MSDDGHAMREALAWQRTRPNVRQAGETTDTPANEQAQRPNAPPMTGPHKKL